MAMNTICRKTMLMLFSPETLEQYPEVFLDNLNLCYREKIGIANYLNNTNHYVSWYSSLPQSLYYLVGDLKENCSYDFYGVNTRIDQELGIKIMIAMLNCGANLDMPNYYDKTIYEIIQEEENGLDSLTTRINNKKFIQFIKDFRDSVEWLN